MRSGLDMLQAYHVLRWQKPDTGLDPADVDPANVVPSIRFTIASLIVAVAVVAVDIVWLKSLMTTQRSVFGFAVEGLDMGLFLMANVLPFGLYPMLSRRGEGRRYLVGFEVGGLAAALAYAGWAWLAPAPWRRRHSSFSTRSGTCSLGGWGTKASSLWLS